MKIRSFGDFEFEIEELRSDVENEAQVIIRVLEIILNHARLAKRNPEGMRHLLSLYGLDKRFKSELKAMEAARPCTATEIKVISPYDLPQLLYPFEC